MISNHDFREGQLVSLIKDVGSESLTLYKKYFVLETGFWNIRIINDLGNSEWAKANAFEHVPMVTAIKGHLRRIKFGQ